MLFIIYIEKCYIYLRYIHCSLLGKSYGKTLRRLLWWQFSFRFLNQMEFHLVRKSKGKLSPRSYPIHCERKWKYNFLSVEAIGKWSSVQFRLQWAVCVKNVQCPSSYSYSALNLQLKANFLFIIINGLILPLYRPTFFSAS